MSLEIPLGCTAGGSRVTSDGVRRALAGGRLAEVDRLVPQDGRMNTRSGRPRLPIPGRIHALLADVEVSAAGRTAEFANRIGPDQVQAGTRAGTQRIRGWHPTARQLAHGDFRDDNVFFRREAPVFAVDFSFMAERARVEGRALTLYFVTPSSAWPAAGTDRDALPWATARRPLCGIGG
jgi:hypothetical protein